MAPVISLFPLEAIKWLRYDLICTIVEATIVLGLVQSNQIAFFFCFFFFCYFWLYCFGQLWDYNRGIVAAEGSEHASAVLSICFSPCRKFFVSGCKDGSIIIWDVPPVRFISHVLMISLVSTSSSVFVAICLFVCLFV